MQARRGKKLRMLQPQFERLEDRSMLSASIGNMPRVAAGPGIIQAEGGAGERYAVSSAYAAGRQERLASDAQALYVAHETGTMDSEFRGVPAMQPTLGPRVEMRSIDPGWSSGVMQDQLVFGPESMRVASMSLSSYAAWDLPVTNSQPLYAKSISEMADAFESYVQRSAPVPMDLPKPSPAVVDNYVLPLANSNRITISTSYLLPMIDQRALHLVSNEEASEYRLPGSNPLDPAGGKVTATGTVNGNSNLYELSSLPPVVARDSTSLTALSATARDLVFQAYAPQLLLAAATNSNERATLAPVATAETAPSEALDGFTQPYDEAIANDYANSTDAIARERDAVNAVLHELNDVESALPTTETNDEGSLATQTPAGQPLDIQIDLQFETFADEAPAGEVDGGMIMLQPTGDANDSGFDLTPVYANHFEQIVEQPAVETSVGMYQAVDVAIDETAAAEIGGDPAGSSVVPHFDIQKETLPAQARTRVFFPQGCRTRWRNVVNGRHGVDESDAEQGFRGKVGRAKTTLAWLERFST